MNRRRVVMLTFEYGPIRCGGLAAALATLCRGLDPERFQPVVVLPRHGRTLPDPPAQIRRRAACDVAIHYHGATELWLLGNDILDGEDIYPEPSGGIGIKKIDEYAERVAELLPDLDASLIHLHDGFGYKCLYAAARLGLPSVLTIHRLHDDEPTLGFAELAASRLVSAVTTVSRSYARERADFFRARRGVRVTPNGIDLDFWDESALPSPRAERRARLCASRGLPDRTTFACVGRLDPDQKGIDVLLAAHEARLSSLPLNLIVVGDGDPALAARLSSRSGANLSFSRGHAPAESVRELFGAVDFVLVPSRYEPFGLAALEAMAMGAIPVVSRVGGLRDVVLDLKKAEGGFGRTFEPGNPDALASAVEGLLALAAPRLEPARMAAKNAARRRSSRAMAGGYESLYDELCGEPPGAPR